MLSGCHASFPDISSALLQTDAQMAGAIVSSARFDGAIIDGTDLSASIANHCGAPLYSVVYRFSLAKLNDVRIRFRKSSTR